MTRVKICGLTNHRDALDAASLGADALGFVFAESPRRVSAELARSIIGALPPFVCTVGVFVDEDPEVVRQIARFCGLDAVQLHGNESPDYCHSLGLKVIKSFRVRDGSFREKLGPYSAQGYLLDTWVPSRPGGTARTFDWRLAAGLPGPVILAGGLTPENVAEAIRVVRPHAVDVSSGVEESPGKKNFGMMKEFIARVRSCDGKDAGSRPSWLEDRLLALSPDA